MDGGRWFQEEYLNCTTSIIVQSKQCDMPTTRRYQLKARQHAWTFRSAPPWTLRGIGRHDWASWCGLTRVVLPLHSLREANPPLKDELKVAHAEGDAKDRRIVDLEAKLAKATSSASEWHLKAKELETQLQAAKANVEWTRSIVAHSVTRSAPPPEGSRS